MGVSQSNSMKSFDFLARDYYSDPKRVAAVENYEMKPGQPMVLEDGSTVHGTIGGGPKKGIPVFDFIKFPNREEGGTCILREKGKLSGEIIIIFIPAGCNDGSIKNSMQPYNSNISESGLSSFWHLLAITENITYCNAVTLKKDQINIVMDKKQLLEKAMRILISGNDYEIGSFKWMKKLDGVVSMDNGLDIPINITEDDLSVECKQNFVKFESLDDITEDVMSNIGYFYHAYTQATVFTGHMHAIAMDYRTKCYDSMESKALEKNLIKNIPVDDIIEYVNNGYIEGLKFDAIMKIEPEPEPEPDDTLSRTKSYGS